MGVGSSRVDRANSSKRKAEKAKPLLRAESAPLPPKIQQAKTNAARQQPFIPPLVPQSIQRSQSTRSPEVRERKERRPEHRAYASVSDNGHHQQYYQTFPLSFQSPTSQSFQTSPLRNPLPVPPKDLLSAAGPDFSRIHYASPAPFVPSKNDELKRSQSRARDPMLLQEGRDVPVQQVEPSSSFSSHSSASTSHPPRQVVANGYGVQSTLPSQMEMNDPRMRPTHKPKARSHGMFTSIMSSMGRRSSEREREPSVERQPKSSLDLPISQPFQLAPRGPPPPQVPPFFFYYPEEPGFNFTPISPHKILYRKKLYPTAEHLYQAMKFLPSKGKGGDPELAEQLRLLYDQPHDVIVEGRKHIKKARPDWRSMRTTWMDEIMYMKFVQHPDLRMELVSTAPAELIFASPVDPFWGLGPDHNGRNELGQSLARVRSRILYEMGK